MGDPNVILSYHPSEENWAVRVQAHLGKFASIGLLPLDTEAARHRLARHEATLASAQVVVLLVSRALLAAENLRSLGLPLLEAQRRERGLAVLALLLEPCADLSRSVLGNLPKQTLVGISPQAAVSEVEHILEKLARGVGEELGGAAQQSTEQFGGINLDGIFDEIYAQHYPALVNFFGHRRLDPETSRDLAQQTMLKVYRGLHGFQSRASSRSWVLRIATNVWRNWVRDHRLTLKRSALETSLEHTREQGLEVAEEDGFWPVQSSNPERLAVNKQAQERIHARISDLSTRQQDCMTRWLEGWSYQEMADEMGVSIQTVRASLHKAKKRVAQELRQEFQDSTESASFAGVGS